MAHDEPSTDFNLSEQIARIARISRLLAECNERNLKSQWAPWQAALVGMTTGAALFAAGMAFSAALMRLHGG